MTSHTTQPVAVVVNDDPTQLGILAGLLGKAQMEARTFEGVEAALAAMDPAVPPDLIVTDLYMPDIDGWRFCRLLRSPEYAAFNEVPILIVSATFAGDHPERIAADTGADAFLPSPVDGKQFVAQAQALIEGTQERRKPSVLIVEDDEAHADLLQKAFQANGYRTSKALTARVAEERFKKSAYDVAVLDHHLPDGTGDDMLEALQARRPECVCLMMTSDPTPALALGWMKRGAAAYLHKPFEPDFLIELCARARRERALLRAEDLLEARTRQLRESEEKYRGLVENMNEVLYTVDENGCINYVSPNVQQIGGYTQAEMMGRPFIEFVHPDDLSGRIEQFKKVLQGAGEPSEYRLVAKDGRPIWVQTHARPIIKDGFPVGVQGVLTNITDLKQAEQALHESETYYRSLIHAMHEDILVIDCNYRIDDINNSALRTLRLTRAELIGRHCHEVAHGLDSPCHEHGEECGLRRVFDTGESCNLHHEHIDADGNRRHIDILMSPLRDSNGTITHVIEAARDVTDLFETQAALRDSEEKYRRLFETMAQGVIHQNADGTIGSVNPAAERILGLTFDQIRGKTSMDPRWQMIEEDGTPVPGTDHPTMIALRTGQTVGPVTRGIYRPDLDRHIWLSITSIPLFAPGADTPFQAYATFTDITERKRAEEALREREQRAAGQRTAITDLVLGQLFTESDLSSALQRVVEGLSATLNVARASVWTLTEDGSELQCLSLYDARQAVHSSGTALKPRDFPHYFEALVKENRIYAEDAQNDPRTRELTEHYLKPLGITSLLDAGIYLEGNVAGVVSAEHIGAKRKWHSDEESFISSVASFVSQILLNAARKRAEAERAHLQAQLNQAQKMESVGRLAGGVAHDFNNMLGVILGHAELALMSLEPTQEIYEDIAEIQKAAQRSADLTRQLLAFARKQTVIPRVLDLNQTIEGMLKMLRRLIGEDIELTWKPGKNLWAVKIDPSQVDQVLANLCVNARDAIAGVGKITIATANAAFDEEYCARHQDFSPGEYVLLAVTDTGCGMDSEMLAHVFEPFFTSKEKDKGTGLGLATVYGAVTQNRGFIKVYSEPDQGTTFNIYLPRHAAEPVALPEQAAGTPTRHASETVLLVEDEPAILDIATTMLKMDGYTVLPASTPGEAMRLAENHAGRIDLLMTDVVMPEMNGRELAKNLLALYPAVKRLFMSGYPSDVISEQGIIDEGVHFIQKPFSKSDLTEKVRKALDGET